MKKFISTTLSLLLIIAVFCGCGKKDTSSTPSQDTATNSTITVDGVELTAYKNITVDWESTSNAQLLQNALGNVEAKVKKITDRAVKEGDTANIDYTGYKNGIKFEGGEAQGYDLSIGSGSFIPGFEDGLIGVKPGETKNLNLTFPKSYQNEDLAGQAVVFKVKVNYISEKYYTDEQRLTAKESVFSSALINHVVDNSKVDELPEKEVESFVEKYREIYEQSATSNGYDSLDAYIEAAGETKEGFEKILKESAETQVKSQFVIEAIAKKEDIVLTDSEYKESVKEYASAYSTTEENFVAANGEDYIKYVLLQEKVSEFLAKNSKCK